MTKKLFLLSGVIAALALASAPASAADIVGLITKTNTNPFFVKMKQGFEAKAKELGLTPQAYAGKYDGDNDGQVAAIETLVNAGAKGILLVPSDSTAMVPTVELLWSAERSMTMTALPIVRLSVKPATERARLSGALLPDTQVFSLV